MKLQLHGEWNLPSWFEGKTKRTLAKADGLLRQGVPRRFYLGAVTPG